MYRIFVLAYVIAVVAQAAPTPENVVPKAAADTVVPETQLVTTVTAPPGAQTPAVVVTGINDPRNNGEENGRFFQWADNAEWEEVFGTPYSHSAQYNVKVCRGTSTVHTGTVKVKDNVDRGNRQGKRGFLMPRSNSENGDWQVGDRIIDQSHSCSPPTPPPTPDQWHLSAGKSTSCDSGVQATQAECEAAVASLASAAGKTPARSLQVGSGGSCGDGSWGGVPSGCVAQSHGDWAAHFKTSGPNCNNGYYQVVCSGKA